jgi:hypothetical protein
MLTNTTASICANCTRLANEAFLVTGQGDLSALCGEESVKNRNKRQKLRVPFWLAVHIIWQLPWEVPRNSWNSVLTIQWHFTHEETDSQTYKLPLTELLQVVPV